MMSGIPPNCLECGSSLKDAVTVDDRFDEKHSCTYVHCKACRTWFITNIKEVEG